MKHTQGKWKIVEVEGDRMTCVHTDKTNIALLVHQKDAKLIASAPAMLEALKEIAEGKGAYSRDKLEHAVNCVEGMKATAKQAIAKAEEEE